MYLPHLTDAIGDLILRRCQLEDAFFISSLLEAPIEQLRARGFPVERILKAASPKPVAAPSPQPPPAPVATIAAIPPVTATSIGKGTTVPPLQASDAMDDSSSIKSHGPDKASITSGDDAVPASTGTAAPESEDAHNDFEVLQQMFPDIDKDYLHQRLGSNPSMEQVQKLAEEMASGSYPKDGKWSETTAQEETASDGPSKDPKKSGLRKKLGRAFNGLRPSNVGGAFAPNLGPKGETNGTSSSSSVAGPGGQQLQEKQRAVPAVEDAQSHDNLGRMLQNAISSSSQVNKHGIHSHDTHLTSIPEGLDRGETCEMIPGHSLKPFPGPRNTGMTTHGIRVFSAREMPASEAFLLQNEAAIELFSTVLERLCEVFSLPRASMAIFHDPTGGTIAFNAGKAIHCNLRFFYSLFYATNSHNSSDCYSYWFVTMAHELSHHFVSAHNKEHGYYTESYVTKYLPKLVGLLASLPPP
jgi:hypothetical protein